MLEDHDLHSFVDVDDGFLGHLVLRLLSATDLARLARCSRRFALLVDHYSAAHSYTCVVHGHSSEEILTALKAELTTRPSFALLVTSARPGLHLTATPAIARLIEERLPRSCHVIGAEVGGIFANGNTVGTAPERHELPFSEQNARDAVPVVPWALLAANLPGTRVQSFCLTRVECDPSHLKKIGLLTGDWDAFLLHPGAPLA